MLHQLFGSNESLLLIAFPWSNSKQALSWERRLEVLPGACIATESINNYSNILPHSKLKLLEVDSGNVTCDECHYSGKVLEMIANLTWQNRFHEIIGITGVLHPNTLLTLWKFSLPVVSLIHFSGIPYSPNVIYMTASTSTLTDSIIAFMVSINRSSIGVITENHHSYFYRVSDNLISRIKYHSNFTINIPLYVQVDRKIHDNSFINKIISTNLQVLFLSTSSSVSVQLLCAAYKNGLVWPKYVWILHSLQVNDLAPSADKECSLQFILEEFSFFN